MGVRGTRAFGAKPEGEIADAEPPVAVPERDEDRRSRPDRRHRPTPMISRYLFTGRRRRARRDEESRSIYVDRPGGWAYLALTAVLALSCLDAIFTLLHLGRGGREANPVMDWAIRVGPVTFLVLKTALTASGMLLLLLHQFFRGVRLLVVLVLLLYLALMVYHLYLSLVL
jgi:hypothetical protein